MMHDPVAMEAVAACIGHKALYGPSLLRYRPAEQIVGSEPGTASTRDHDREATVGGVDEVPNGVGHHRARRVATPQMGGIPFQMAM